MSAAIPQSVILYVEDDPNDVLLVKRASAKIALNAELRHVSNGDEALSYLAGEPPYADRRSHPIPLLVLLDLKLPRRNGIELTGWLRARSDALRRLPVVMFTSSDRTADINEAYDAGVNSYLVKPESMQELTECLALIKQYWLDQNEFPDIGQSDAIL